MAGCEEVAGEDVRQVMQMAASIVAICIYSTKQHVDIELQYVNMQPCMSHHGDQFIDTKDLDLPLASSDMRG